MKVKFILTRGRETKFPKQLGLALKSTELPDQKNKEFIVFGLSIHSGVLHYLIDLEGQAHPHWYPSIFFDITDAHIHNDWKIRVSPYEFTSGFYVVMGYHELVDDPRHNDKLIDADPLAREGFARQKRKLQESLSPNYTRTGISIP